MGEQGQRSGATIAALLSAMMFLQFFIWGSWYVSMTGFINRTGMGGQEGFQGVTSAAYMVGPIAAIVSPFFLGMIADRFFASQRVLAAMHLIGGVVMLAVPVSARSFDGSTLASFGEPFILLLLVHMLCFMPTLGLSSSVALHNMTDAKRQFPMVRVWGTIGWIVGNIAVSFLPGKDASASQFYLAGGAGILLAVFSLTLPNTPPSMAGQRVTLREVLGLDSLRLLIKPSYAVFVICSFLICIPLAGYYQQARNFVEATGSTINDSAVFTMSLGQMSEIFFMLVMPLCFARLGVKWMLAIGMLAWVIRYGLFAGAADDHIKWMVLGGVVLHGICYDFFFVTGQIYVDNEAGPRIRSQAQGFYVLITQGLGMLIGAEAFRWLVTMSTTKSETSSVLDWKSVWMYPAGFALAILVVFVLLFRDKGMKHADLPEAPPAPGAPGEPLSP